MAVSALFVLFVAFVPVPLLYLLTRSRNSHQNLPPGSLGIPFIGQSLGLLRAMSANRSEEWLARRVKKYGPVSKLTLFGAPTVFVTGQAGNKLVFSNDALVPQQPKSVSRIIGERNMLELNGEDHKRVRGAVGQFLRPEVLKKSVAAIDGEVRRHLLNHWTGRRSVQVLPLSKSLTFDIICSQLFGIRHGDLRERLKTDFVDMIAGVWAVPLNLPFTNFRKSLSASKRARRVLAGLVNERRAALQKGDCVPHDDLITYLIGMELTDEEIVDNAVLVMVAGYDTSSTLITFMIRHLTNDSDTCAQVVREQEEIAKAKAPGEPLNWEDILKMKYTWKVAMEILRTIPPLVGSFRKTLKDLEYNGFLIPKGWQVFWATSITHLDPNIFPEPTKFEPNRFSSTSPPPPYCFIPFGAGQRICPGNEFARLETLVMMHHFVTQFKWKLCCKHDTFKRDPMPSPYKGLPIQLVHKNSLLNAACI